MADQFEVFDAVAAERRYQDRKWGSITEHPHSLGDWLLILEGEVKEAKAAWLKLGTPATLLEVLQVAAVGVACLEDHGIVRRPDGASVVDARRATLGLLHFSDLLREQNPGLALAVRVALEAHAFPEIEKEILS